MRLTFPTKFAKEQNTYFVKDRLKMYLFDHTTQYIFQISFVLGEISSTGLDKYVYEKYSARDTFLNDQLVYDSQLGYDAFNINKAAITVSSGGTYSSYANQLATSKKVMRDKEWITKFAQKHFLLIFKANNLNETPKILYGFRMKDMRDHPYDKFKY